MSHSLREVMLPINEVGFRNIVNKIVYIECREVMETMFGKNIDKRLTGLIGYCYIDHERGISFQPGVCGIVTSDSLQLADLPNNDIMYVLRVSDEGFTNVFEQDGARMETYAIPTDSFWFDVSILIDDMSMFDGFKKRFVHYKPSEDVAILRDNRELDPFRNDTFPDDVKVVLYREGKKLEEVWVRCEFDTDRCMFGILLNEPYGDLDYHENECIGFEFYDMGDEKILLANGLKAEKVD